MISFKSHTDSGNPTFVRSDEEFQIVCGPGDRGRWLGDYLEPLTAGQELTLLAQVRTSSAPDVCVSLMINYWKNEPGMVLHSTDYAGEVCGTPDEFKQFIHPIIVPDNVKLLRIDFRAWSGPGSSIMKDVRIVEDDPPPIDPPVPADHQVTIDLDVHAVIWRVTANDDGITCLRMPK